MGSFTISLPEEDQKVIEQVATKERRSRTQQIVLILEEWIKANKG